MQKCSYCGRENEDAATSCGECGTPLSERQTPFRLATPHRMMGEVQRAIWEYFAVKRGQLYLAGFLIGSFCGLIGALLNSEHGFPLWCVPAAGTMGAGAVWVLSCKEKLQARIAQARAEGNPTGGQQVLVALLFSVLLVVAALLVIVVWVCLR